MNFLHPSILMDGDLKISLHKAVGIDRNDAAKLTVTVGAAAAHVQAAPPGDG